MGRLRVAQGARMRVRAPTPIKKEDPRRRKAVLELAGLVEREETVEAEEIYSKPSAACLRRRLPIFRKAML
jgi:hypothetical protein